MNAVRAMVAMAGIAAASAFAAPSFDCARAATRVEKAVCADAALGDLDELLARYYAGAAEQLRENAACLKEDQRAWISTRRDRCADAACLKAAYLERLSELEALQPGLNAPKRLTLPPHAKLVWAIAPDDDLPLPPRASLEPGEAEGALALGNNGYVVRESSGREVLLVPDILRSGSSETALHVLVESPVKARVRVKGHLGDDRGAPYFDHHHCIFVRALP